MILKNNQRPGSVGSGTGTGIGAHRKEATHTYSPMEPPMSSTSTIPSSAPWQTASPYSFSLGRPGSLRAPSSPSRSRQQQPLPRPATHQQLSHHQRQQQESPQQRPLNMGRSHTLGNLRPTLTSPKAVAGNSSRHQRVKSVETGRMDANDEQHNKLQSHFRKARSQAPFDNDNQGNQHRSPRRSPAVDSKSKVLASSEHACPRSPLSPAPRRSTINGPSDGSRTSSVTSQVTDCTSRHEMIQYLRAKAQETRLELLALEQLEKDIQDDGEEMHENLDSPFLSGPSCSPLISPMVPRPVEYISPPLFTTQRSRVRSGSLQPANTQLHPMFQAQHPQPRQSPQKPYQRVLVAAHATLAQSPTVERSHLSWPTSPVGYQPRNTESGYTRQLSGHGNSARPRLAPRLALAEAVSRHGRNQSSARTPSSPYSSPSPPVSPVSSDADDGMAGHSATRTTLSCRRHAQTKQYLGWKPDAPESGTLRQGDRRRRSEDDGSSDDSVLYEQFDDFQEDLRDTTLSEMMNRHLVMLSESEDNSDDTSTSFPPGHSSGSDAEPESSPSEGEQEEELGLLNEHEGDENIDIEDSHYEEADMTFADKTCHFMRGFDRSGATVPSLLSETIPENDFGNLSFVTYMPDMAMESESGTASLGPASRNQQPQHLQSPVMQLPAFPAHKESILDEFLKSLPPLPLSPETKRPAALSSRTPAAITSITSHTTPSAQAFSISSTATSSSSRSVPLPAPIITSRERCQQILRQQGRPNPKDRAQRSQHPYHSMPMSTSPRPSSPLAFTSSPFPGTPWSMLSSPLTSQTVSSLYRDGGVHSEVSTPTSIYNSAREEFTFDDFFRDDTVFPASVTKSNSGGTKNILTEPHMCQEDNTPTGAKTSTPSTVTITTTAAPLPTPPVPGRQPLDMIIVRPAKAAAVARTCGSALTNGESSPWSPLSSTSSTASNSSTSSSWSWFWPSSTYQSRANSFASSSSTSSSSDESQIPAVSNHGQRPTTRAASTQPRLPSTFENPSSTLGGVNIKSRSMSSLVKHQNGWLGFQVLDVKMVASGRCHIVVVTRSNQVYSCWEPNSDIGGGDSNSGVATVKEANSQEIEEILGRRTKTQVDPSLAQDTTCQPGLVQIEIQSTLPSNIIKIVCSDSATFLLTENGDLWGWGSFEDTPGKRIGLLHQETSSRPIRICAQRIKDVVCGRNHVLILNSSGDVISWGANNHHQLGRPVCAPASSTFTSSATRQEEQAQFDLSPYFIESLPPGIIGIGAGKLSSFAWDEERLYGWGDNTFGQLGRASGSNVTARLSQERQLQQQHQREATMSASIEYAQQRDTVKIPKEISLHWKGKSLKQVQGGERHTVILTLSGLVITMGNDDFGQLGVTSNTPTTPMTAVLPGTDTPSSSAGSSPAASPSIANSTLSSSTRMLSSCANPDEDSGSIKVSKLKTRLFPALVRIGPGMKEIRCGDFHTVTCSDSGHMFTWGRGYEGVLAIHNLHGSSNSIINSSSSSPRSTWSPSSSTIVGIGRTRRVVSVSAMRAGISIALVSNT